MTNTTRDIINRLEASIKYDVVNGDCEERAIFETQVKEAIKELKRLEKRDDILSCLEAAGGYTYEAPDEGL